MDTRKAATEYRLAQWAQMLQAKAHNRQTIKDFCASAGVSRNTYFYWQRRLRETACEGLALQDATTEKGLVPSGWMRLEAAEPALAETGVTIEVGSCRVTATVSTDPALLAQVCRMLKSL